MSTDSDDYSVKSHALPPEWNATRTVYPRDSTVHALFEAEAERHPGAMALRFGDDQLTYGELNRRANRLAHLLRGMGVGRDVLVGCALERSFDLLMAMLAVLKAGGAYVPLDPSYPDERLEGMIQECRIPVLLAHPSQARRLRSLGARIVTSGDPELAGQPEENPAIESRARDLAYVMYTSGSTGRPKGVMIEHRSIVRLVRNTDYLDIHPADVFLQLAPASFDASTLEIWAPLLNGASLAIMPPAMPSLDEIGEAIRRYGVTTLWLTAGLFHRMIDQRLDDLLPLRQLVAGGDVLSPAHVRRLLARADAPRLINGYGPTEGTTFSCCHTVTASDAAGDSIPIGRPIANTRVYFVDEQMVPVLPGMEGELVIAGDGLARGYLDDPALTREKFVSFAADPDGRVYRSGDLARYRGDGVIQFLGRIDQQIKIRGFRIEPAEIEAALCAHPEVGEAAVIARSDDGGKRLIAYVIPRGAVSPHAPGLRAFLKEKIPQFMIPAEFVTLAALPLSSNGKVDRSQLASMPSVPAIALGLVRPETAMETTIAAVWKRVLGVDSIGTGDNFFDLGGDSLQLIQVHAELQTTSAAGASVTDLFEFATVRDLARHLSGAGEISEAQGAIEARARRQIEAQENMRRLRLGVSP